MKKFIVSSTVIGLLFAGFLSVDAAYSKYESGTMKIAEKAINI
ncbi:MULTISPECIES: hypothetical protein [Bacillus]|nr:MULTISPECIES: hypothetical protein [Bacillus]WFA07044.1 hypothetical protein P3X63_09845 [Bacillus sp. HSf4]